MKKNNMIWGIILILVGIIIGLNAFNITNINLLFDGWWTFIIIIPCFVRLFTEKQKTVNVIGILIGLSLLLNAQNIITLSMILKVLIPLIIIIIGLSLIFKDTISKKIRESLESENETLEYYATFSGQNLKFKDKEVDNLELNAIFGGLNCDLSESVIKRDKLIKVYAIFGGVKIKVPENVKVVLNSTPIFAGVNNKTKEIKTKNPKTIYIDILTIFGGVEIK